MGVKAYQLSKYCNKMDFHIVAPPVFQLYLKFGHKLSSNALFIAPLLHSPEGGGWGVVQSGDLSSLSLSLPLVRFPCRSLSLTAVYIISLMVWINELLLHSHMSKPQNRTGLWHKVSSKLMVSM